MPQTYNEGAEVAVISCILKNGSLAGVVEDILQKDSFAWKPLGWVYDAIRDVIDADLFPDIITVSAQLDRRNLLDAISLPSNDLKGQGLLEHIASLSVDESQIETYALTVQEFAAIRKLKKIAEKIQGGVESGQTAMQLLNMIDLETGKVSASIGIKSSTMSDSKEATRNTASLLYDALKGKNDYIPTLIKAWDDYTNGLFPGRLYMIVAASNDGKSALAHNILYNISITSGIPGFVISLEMSKEEVVRRLVQIRTGISPLRLEKGELYQGEEALVNDAFDVIGKAPITYDDSTELILAMLRTKIRKAVSAGCKYVIIDQLEQLSINGADNMAEYLRLNYITYRIKAYAREMNVPIILIHQMNRSINSGDNRGKNKEPEITDLAQAGEKAADAIVIIRHIYDEAKVILNSFFYWVKNRQSKKGRQEVKFLGEKIKFIDPGQEKVPEFMQQKSFTDDGQKNEV